MKNLWAPWRMEYIKGEKNDRCIFCDAPKADHAEGLVLFSGSLSTVILNRYPYSSAHLMVSPVRHVARIEDLTPEESIDIFRLLRHCTASLTKAIGPEGFNIGMNIGKAAGAGIDEHLHLHVVPRWNGDHNFMPVLSDTSVMPEHLKETFLKLQPFFERI